MRGDAFSDCADKARPISSQCESQNATWRQPAMIESKLVEPHLSTPLSSEQRSALRTPGSMSYRLSAKYTEVDLLFASRSVTLFCCTKNATSAMCTPSSRFPLSSSLQKATLVFWNLNLRNHQCFSSHDLDSEFSAAINQQVRFVSVKAERHYHPSRDNAKGWWWGGGGFPP